MDAYERKALYELNEWKVKMSRPPSITNRFAKMMQTRMNSFIPDKMHKVITGVIKNMVKVVLFGSDYTTNLPLFNVSIKERETEVKDKIIHYRKAAMASGAWTGSGGILLGLADFPILISLKLKLLFEIAALYGFDTGNYKERLYILYVFQLAFSSQERTRDVFYQVLNWEHYVETLPENLNSFDWRTFQQEYRDYIDLAKMLQLVPGIGAVVGAYANYKLVDKLGKTAMYAYRLRTLKV